jgi:glutathione-regulated potassium-efflux system ancillary protein KefC
METNFLGQALVYLAAGVIAVPLFKKLGLGSVLGYLAAGMAIGPWGLRLIGDPQTVLHFAEFGVVMLLFLIGLELDPRRLWTLRRPILGMGSVQVLATGAAVAALALALGQPLAVALVAGMGLAMSSTAIALASLQEKSLLATPGGQAGFSVLLFQDLAVIPLLLTVGLLSEGKSSLDWRAAAVGVGLIAALITGGRFVLRPARVIAATKLREVLPPRRCSPIGIALLMLAAGLSMALGAFLAGDSRRQRYWQARVDIEPFKGCSSAFSSSRSECRHLTFFARAPRAAMPSASSFARQFFRS